MKKDEVSQPKKKGEAPLKEPVLLQRTPLWSCCRPAIEAMNNFSANCPAHRPLLAACVTLCVASAGDANKVPQADSLLSSSCWLDEMTERRKRGGTDGPITRPGSCDSPRGAGSEVEG